MSDEVESQAAVPLEKLTRVYIKMRDKKAVQKQKDFLSGNIKKKKVSKKDKKILDAIDQSGIDVCLTAEVLMLCMCQAPQLTTHRLSQ